MSSSSTQALFDLWERDPAFRAQLAADPVAALESRGASVTPTERRALEKLASGVSDTELSSRLNAKNC